MALIMIYAFAMLTAMNYGDTFDSQVVGEVNVCKSLISCVMQMIDLGLRFGGGIAETQEMYDLDDNKFLGKWFYNIFFFIFISVIFLNVVFGIIIDTFAELRDKQSERGKFLKFPKILKLSKFANFYFRPLQKKQMLRMRTG